MLTGGISYKREINKVTYYGKIVLRFSSGTSFKKSFQKDIKFFFKSLLQPKQGTKVGTWFQYHWLNNFFLKIQKSLIVLKILR